MPNLGSVRNPDMNLEVVGDGLAGLLLAKRLTDGGAAVKIRGDGKTNTPPVGLVHLFAGRTFRRSELELSCFEKAVEFWRAEPLAEEHTVRRSFRPGDRLERSLSEAVLPEVWTPRRLDRANVEYQPGFAVAAQALEKRLREELASSLRVSQESVPDVTVLAVGARAPERWPQLSWDCSGGRTVEADSYSASKIFIGGGLHRAPFPGRDSVVLGGRFTPLGAAPDDELEKAEELTSQPHTFVSSWSGHRCAPQDHRPVLGWIDETTFAFFGFGSRALFWLPYCVEIAALALGDCQAEIPVDLGWTRLLNEQL